MKYRIAWRSLITDYRGRGEFILSREAAVDVMTACNRRYRNKLIHWVEGEAA